MISIVNVGPSYAKQRAIAEYIVRAVTFYAGSTPCPKPNDQSSA